jgi:S1-C subfamily serine protease
MLLGMVLAVVFPGVVPAAQFPQPPAGALPQLTRPLGGLGIPSAPCGQNRLTTLEQIQNGATLADIQQQETRAVACKVNPAVVKIIASGFGAAPGQEYETISMATPGPSIGAGVILSADGFIVTNRHVIKGKPRSIVVVLQSDGKPDEQVPAVLKGEDLNTDLAVLKIDKAALPFLEFNLQVVRQGDTVFAFGSPRGVGISMTKGIISAPVRQVQEEDALDYIQTDAAINPGNSGGALVDINGKLVGINTFILSGSGGNEGLNFAIPSDVVWYIYNQIKINGYVIRGTIGITTRNLTPELIRALKLPIQLGVYIEDVDPKGPADAAGVQPGDIVTGYDSRPLDGRLSQDFALDLKRAISGKKKGQTIILDLWEHGNRKTVNVSVDQSSPISSDDAPQLSNDLIVPQLGIYAIQLTFSGAAQMGLRSHQGVMVAAKVQAMTAASSELEIRDIITEVNSEPVSNQEELQQALDNADPDSPVALRVERDKKYVTLLVNIN